MNNPRATLNENATVIRRSVGQMKKRNYVLLINLLALFLLDTLKAKLNISRASEEFKAAEAIDEFFLFNEDSFSLFSNLFLSRLSPTFFLIRR